MGKNDAFVAKIVNMRLTKIFMAIFAPNESFATLEWSLGVCKTYFNFYVI